MPVQVEGAVVKSRDGQNSQYGGENDSDGIEIEIQRIFDTGMEKTVEGDAQLIQ
jgi:hypothetical protein